MKLVPRYPCVCCRGWTLRALCADCEYGLCPRGHRHETLALPTWPLAKTHAFGTVVAEVRALYYEDMAPPCEGCSRPARGRYWNAERGQRNLCAACAGKQPPGPRTIFDGLYVETVGHL